MAGELKLLSVAAARARMLAAISPLPVERIPLRDVLGRTLRAPLLASRDQPPFRGSAMDGWAVRAEEGAGWRRVIGESAAGHPFAGRLGAGEAVRVFTGAPVPEGADAVVLQEEATAEAGQVRIPSAPRGQHIRPAGQDFRAGQMLLAAPCRLDPWRLALAAAAGAATLQVSSRPRVAILPNGEEVVGAGAVASPWQIFDSGGPALAALAQSWGASAAAGAPVGDEPAAIAAAVEAARCDLVVTVGGASVGEHDLVKPALARLGLEILVESVAVRPGKPTWFGVLGDGCCVLGLPGNPASALVCAELFLRPLVRAFQGDEPALGLIAARVARALPANGAREHWMRARLARDPAGGLMVDPFGDQDSALVTVLAAADALLRRPAGAPALRPGEPVEVLSLARG